MSNQQHEKSHDGSSESSSSKQRQPSTAEWIVGAIAALLILGGIGFLAYQAWHGTSRPPMVEVRVKQIVPQPGRGYAVEFVAVNRGGTTARSLMIEGRLLESKGGREVEKSSATLTWVPAHAERQGGLFFSHNPREYWLEIGPKGYDRL